MTIEILTEPILDVHGVKIMPFIGGILFASWLKQHPT
jgi:hypothetical protein